MVQSSFVRPVSKRGEAPLGIIGFLFLIPSLFLLGAGVKAWVAAASNRAPTTLTYTEFAKRMPKFGWYTVTGDLMDVRKSVYWEQNGVCISVFAPLSPVTGYNASRPDIYVEVCDSRTWSAFQDMTYARKSGGEAGAQKFISEHTDIFVQRRDVSGLVSFGHRDPVGEWARVGLDAANTTFIEDGWRPNPALGYAGTAIGLAFCIICVRLMAKGFPKRVR